MALFRSPDYSGETQDAINAFNNAAQKAIEIIKQHEAQGRTDITSYLDKAQQYSQPYVSAGESALNAYLGALGLGGSQAQLSAVQAFQNSPEFQYALNEAMKSTQAKGTATGATGSGAEQKALMNQATQMANQQYTSWENQLSQLTGIGQQSAERSAGREMKAGSELARQGQQYSNTLARLYESMGSADANAILAQMAMESKNYAANRGILSMLAGIGAGYFAGRPKSVESIDSTFPTYNVRPVGV